MVDYTFKNGKRLVVRYDGDIILDDDQWITVNGSHILIKDGVAQNGPFKGQKYTGRKTPVYESKVRKGWEDRSENRTPYIPKGEKKQLSVDEAQALPIGSSIALLQKTNRYGDEYFNFEAVTKVKGGWKSELGGTYAEKSEAITGCNYSEEPGEENYATVKILKVKDAKSAQRKMSDFQEKYQEYDGLLDAVYSGNIDDAIVEMEKSIGDLRVDFSAKEINAMLRQKTLPLKNEIKKCQKEINIIEKNRESGYYKELKRYGGSDNSRKMLNDYQKKIAKYQQEISKYENIDKKEYWEQNIKPNRLMQKQIMEKELNAYKEAREEWNKLLEEI